MRFLSLALCGAVIASSPALAAEPDSLEVERVWHVDLEADPLPFLLQGFSAVLAVKPASLPRLSFKVAALALSFPQSLIEMNPANSGFSARVRFGYSLNVNYFFGHGRGGFFAGPIALMQHLRYGHGDAPRAMADVSRLTLGALAGYQWFPFDANGLYLHPWLGLSGAVNVAGEPVVDGRTYQESAFAPMFGLHLGYEL
jgi:hypothetical protein